jgi:hypothetical protein
MPGRGQKAFNRDIFLRLAMLFESLISKQKIPMEGQNLCSEIPTFASRNFSE